MQKGVYKPKLYLEQKREARAALKDSGLKIDRTFDFPNYKEGDYRVYRLFQKRRLSVQFAKQMLSSEDPIKKDLALYFFSRANPRVLAKELSFEELKKIYWDSHSAGAQFKENIISAIIFSGKDGVDYLDKIISDIYLSYDVKIDIIKFLKKYGYMEALKTVIAKHPELIASLDPSNLKKRQMQINEKDILLGEKEPIVANPDLKTIVKKFDEVQRISDDLKKQFGDRFVGIVIVGSTTKGYATPESDIDYVVIGDLSKNEIQIKSNLKLHFVHMAIPRAHDLWALSALFNGIFFGDKELLLQKQREFIKWVTPKQWDFVRGMIYSQESKLSKAFERSNLSEREKRRIFSKTALRVSPRYDEMKRQLGID